MSDVSITITPSVGSSVSMTRRCRTVPITSEAANIIIRFPGMNGGLVQRSGQRYERISCEGWLDGSTVAEVLTKHAALATALHNLRGTPRDTILITYTDGSSKTISYVVLAGALQSGEVCKHGTSYVRDVSFTVERLK